MTDQNEYCRPYRPKIPQCLEERAERRAQSLSAPQCSTSDTRRIEELLALGDIYTASGFPLESRDQIDLYLAYKTTPQTARDPDEPYPCW